MTKHSWREIDDMPPNYKRVILWIVPNRHTWRDAEGEMIMAWRQPDGWSFDREGKARIKIKPTHWRPLPWPPQHVVGARAQAQHDAAARPRLGAPMQRD